MISMTNLLLLVCALFILGVSAGVYSGNELTPPKLNYTAENQSVITNSVIKMADGGIALFFELANIIGHEGIKNNINFIFIYKLAIYLTFGAIAITLLVNLTKLFVYIYVIRQEIKLSLKEKKELNK